MNARAAGGWRISWLQEIAADSERLNWTIDEGRVAVTDDVEWVNAARPYTPNSAGNTIRDGLLAAHPAVRRHFARLIAIIDEMLATQSSLVNDTVQRRYHGLQELMRLQFEPRRRYHAAGVAAYSAYLQQRRATKLAKTKRLGEPSMEQSPSEQPREQAPLSVGAEQFEAPRAPLTFEADLRSIVALMQKSSSTGIPIQRLIDAAVQNFLR